MDAIYFRVNDANIYILAGSFNQKKIIIILILNILFHVG
jgi:hypothetical protein